jgi:transglutaminase-like putative cysteine protease
MGHPPARDVSSYLELVVHGQARLAIQVAASARPDDLLTEKLAVTLDGLPVPVTELSTDHGGRMHVLTCEPGRLAVRYEAQVATWLPPPDESDVWEYTYLRPSRYAESDRLAAIAATEFAGLSDPAQLLPAVSSWVGTRLNYVFGSSGPTDGAVDTLLSGSGVCRDFAHLTIALLRALDVPARLAAVYAPGLWPMDFHAVAEAKVQGQWRVVDATLLAPRSSLVRIATGRDAADTAFLSTYGGQVDLVEQWVTATVDGELPSDDLNALVSLA